MKDGKVFIWMSMIGFEKNDPDRGAKRFLDQTGFVPDGACALLYHSDFFHQHRGMEEEYELPPDICAYYGSPRNTERERQVWTNHDLRDLAHNLEENGTHLYASIMGGEMNNAYHQEWINDYPEVRRHFFKEESQRGPFALKRFKDGTYYEDFFIDKVCQTLQDYGMKGIHLADGFFPSSPLNSIGFSSEFVEQFLDHSGVTLPEEVAATMGCDDTEAEAKRYDYIYNQLREEWIKFHAWRWEVFMKKLCDRVHAIGKEVLVLGLYCTDPFETYYRYGVDMRRIVQAGVDYVTANVLPTHLYMGKRDYRFERYMALIPTHAAHLPKGHLLSMLGIQDSTEEWNVLHHNPSMHERDIYSILAYQMIDGDGVSRAAEGYYICLGDGIPHEDWMWEQGRWEVAMTLDAQKVESPSMYWSDYAFEGMLHEYIHTRRWIPFKQFYELAKGGAYMAATVRPEGLAKYSGTLFVPNFDMLSPEEQKAIAAYDRGSVLCTANPGFDPTAYDIQPEICFSDRFSDWPMTAFAFNCQVSEELRDKMEELLKEDDGVPNLDCAPEDAEEFENPLDETLTFAKVTTGFRDAMALLLVEINGLPFETNCPYMAFRRKDGAYRLYLYNDHRFKYRRAFVAAKKDVADVKIASKFPILPPRFTDRPKDTFVHNYDSRDVSKNSFEVRVQPGGVDIVDVYFK